MFGNSAIQAAEATLKGAVELIRQRHPETDATAVQRFVQDQFAAMNADPSVTISAEGIAQRYDEVVAGQQAGDTRIQADIAKLLFKLLRQKAAHQHLQLSELQAAFHNATSTSLSRYTVELQVVLEWLQEQRYVTVKQPGNRMFVISQGLDFDEWSRAMTSDNESKGSVTNNTTYNVSGQGARLNVNSTDYSINIVGDGAKVDVQGQLADLRRAIDAAPELSDTDRQSAHQVVDAVQAEFQKESPVKAVVTALLNGLPKVAALASISSAIHTWFL